MDYRQIINAIEKIAPPELSEEWDNSGQQIYCGQEEIARVLTALEITDEVIDEACRTGAGMIVTHHPLIFSSLRKISTEEAEGRYIRRLIREDISVYAAHLSFDNAERGNNFRLAQILGLENIYRPGSEGEDICGMIGYLPRTMSLKEAAIHTERALDLPAGRIRMVDGGNPRISKTAICTGGGGDLIDAAIKEECQLLITGDIRHHEAHNAKASGVSLIDAGHYGTEKIFAENFSAQLREETEGSLEITESTVNTDPFML